MQPTKNMKNAIRSPSRSNDGFFYGYVVVIAATCIMVSCGGAVYAFGVFFKPIINEFGWTHATISGAFSLSYIMYGLIGIVMGRVNDRLGPRLVLTVSGLFTGLGYVLMSQTSSIWQLYLFYGIILGTGLGATWVPLVSTVARWFILRRGAMTGIVVAGLGFGALIMPPIANWLILTHGWRVSYLILGSIVLLIMVLAAQFLKRDPTAVGQAPYGEDNTQKGTMVPQTHGFSLSQASRTWQFWMTFVILFFFLFTLYTVMVHIAPHSIGLGIPASSAANIIATVGIFSIFGKVGLGAIGDRIGNRLVFVIAFVLMTGVFWWLKASTEVWMLFLFAAVFGLAYGAIGASESPLVASLFGLKSHGLVLGAVNLGFTIGGATGPLVAGYIFDVSGSYQTAFSVCMGFSVFGLVLTLLLRPVQGTDTKI